MIISSQEAKTMNIDKPKILLVSFSDNSDMQNSLFGLYEQLKDTYDVFTLSIINPKVVIRKTDKTWFVDCPKRPGITKKSFDVKLLTYIIRKIREERFDVIYFESLHLWNLPLLFFSNAAQTYQVIHDVIPHQGDKQTKAIKLMNKIVVYLADKIVIRNQKYKTYLTKTYNIKPNRVKFLSLERPFPTYTPPKRMGVFLFFGRINPYKGIDNLVEITSKCPNIKFKVVGRTETQMERILGILKTLPNVCVEEGYVTDEKMKEEFTNCDWVIVPYKTATQSGIIIDAYKYSRPVIAFSVGAITEQVENGVTGFLVEAGDNASFAGKLNQVATMDMNEYAMMCKNAYNYGVNRYSAQKVAKDFIEMVSKDANE